MLTHIAIAATAKGVVDTIQMPTEQPAEGEVLLNVAYSAMIPPDAYIVDGSVHMGDYPIVVGFTAAGTVEKLGPGVENLEVGDRVTAFAYGPSRQKGVQKYCIQPSTVCAKVPDDLSLDAAATIPDNFVCAYYTVFNQLSLPMPSSLPATADPPLTDAPILIYGAGATSGQYMVRLLHLARYRKIFAVAFSRHHDYLRSLGATHLFDYKSPSLVDDISSAAGGDGKISLVVDCISAQSTMGILSKVVSPLGTVALLMPVKGGTTLYNGPDDKLILDMPIPEDMNPFPEGTNITGVRTFFYQEVPILKERLMPEILPQLLGKGLIQPARFSVMEKGDLKQRVEEALDMFRNNDVRGEKLVIKVD